MSKLLVRIWQTVRKKRHLVGRDLEGNQFFEYRVPEDARRTRRTVEYDASGDMWDNASGISRLPAQWISWLSHTRHNPPSLEELQKDKERQEQLALNVAHLKQQEDDEIRRRNQGIRIPATPAPAFVRQSRDHPAAPEPKPIGPTPEPQPWAPRLRYRG